MSIDWITVAAQIANFLVLVWLLKRFLYRPILDGIDAREAEIKDRMQEAERAQAQAREVQQNYEGKVQALDAAQADLAAAVRKAAEDQRDQLLAEAQTRLEAEHAAWRAQQNEAAQKYTTALHGAGAAALLALTRKAVLDLSGDTLEQHMALHLLQKLAPMAGELQKAAGDPGQAVVTSHDALPQDVKDALGVGLKQHFPKIAVQFAVDNAQPPGLAMQIGGAQLDWNVDTYVDSLNVLVQDQLATPHGR